MLADEDVGELAESVREAGAYVHVRAGAANRTANNIDRAVLSSDTYVSAGAPNVPPTRTVSTLQVLAQRP